MRVPRYSFEVRRSTLLLLLLAPFAGAQTLPSTQPGQRRTSKLTFLDRSPLATTAESNRRFHWNEKIGDVDLEAESFQVYVPQDFKSGEPFGLFVWISSGPMGGIPVKGWLDVLDKHRLIWIGANKSGNERLVADRIRLA